MYPRYDSVARFLSFLVRFPALQFHVRNLTLVAEGMKVHEYGYDWAWEDLQNWENVVFNNNDFRLVNEINAAHAEDLFTTNSFIFDGGYRIMLGLVLSRCHNLRSVTVRKLKVSTLKDHPPASIH
jgi:hypothetical protein